MASRQVSMILPPVSPLPPHYHPTPDGAKGIAKAVYEAISDGQHEWLAAVYLDAEDMVLGEPRLIYHGDVCGVPLDYSYEVLWHDPPDVATQIVTTRFHPHPKYVISPTAPEKLTQLYRQAEAHQLDLAQHILIDASGRVRSLWCQPPRPLAVSGGSSKRRKRSSVNVLSLVTRASQAVAISANISLTAG